MREGKPWGFMIRSGHSPSSVNGMSSWSESRGWGSGVIASAEMLMV